VCGIFGYLAAPGRPSPPADLMHRMAAALHHRGPDEGGVHADSLVALGSRRLAIVDLEHGRQPLANESGSLRLVCNGEIYNAPELRTRLEGRHRFRTHSDVEVLLHLYEDEGDAFLDDVEGMFAIALWDSWQRRLVLARDRMGEKPLYHATHAGVTYFASEPNALRLVQGVGVEPDAEALRLQLALGYFPAPYTPWRDIRKLVPGSLAVLRPGDPAPRFATWWRLRDHALRGALIHGAGAPDDGSVDELRTRVESSVRRQLMADVPLGVALSGGLDSALIATFAARHARGPLNTFTVSFADPSYDESAPALELARAIGATPHVIRADSAALVRALDTLSAHMDEPLADPALLPTFLLAETARRHVKVILGGEGADELFGGYPTYIGHPFADAYARWPEWIRDGVVAPLVAAWPPSDRKVTVGFLLKRFVRHAARPLAARHAAWFGTLPAAEVEALAGPLLRGRHGQRCPEDVFAALLGDAAEWRRADLAQVMYLDALTFLGEGLLTKMDRAAMACSLESRSPYLGRGVVEFAARMPARWKVHGTATKIAMRRAAWNVVPDEFLRRRKRGLSVPLARLFREELRDRLVAELAPERLDAEGLLDGAAVSRLVRDHIGRRADHGRALYALLVLVLWYRNHVVRGPRTRPVAASEKQPEALASALEVGNALER
jgi:asparagine synthase (glutamine-hydrolysing)